MRITKFMGWIGLLCIVTLSIPLLSAYGYVPVRLIVVLAAAKRTDDRPEDIGYAGRAPLNHEV